MYTKFYNAVGQRTLSWTRGYSPWDISGIYAEMGNGLRELGPLPK